MVTIGEKEIEIENIKVRVVLERVPYGSGKTKVRARAYLKSRTPKYPDLIAFWRSSHPL